MRHQALSFNISFALLLCLLLAPFAGISKTQAQSTFETRIAHSSGDAASNARRDTTGLVETRNTAKVKLDKDASDSLLQRFNRHTKDSLFERTFDVKRNFGATGNGATQDTDAFLKLSAAVNGRCQNEAVKVVIPPGSYIVGKQLLNTKGHRYYGVDVLSFANCTKPILVEGKGAVLKHPAGMRFGTFNQDGTPYIHSEIIYETSSLAFTGFMVHAVNCQSVTVRGLELNGNSTKYIIGGKYDAQDTQAISYGLAFDSVRNVSVESVYAHHFGLDGVFIKYPGLTQSSAATPTTLKNVRSEYNGRQGMSIVGGIGITAINCDFSHTGYAINEGTGKTLENAPKAGVDIEPESSIVKNVTFLNCRFEHVKGVGLLAYFPTTASDITVRNCRLWNFNERALWTNAPRFHVYDSEIYGAIANAYVSNARPQDATKFYNCKFEDKVHPTYGAAYKVGPYMFALDNLPDNGGLLFEDCSFINNNSEGIYVDSATRKGSPLAFVFDNCTFILKHDDFVAVTLVGGVLRDCRFIDGYPTGSRPAAQIIVGNGVTGRLTRIEGKTYIEGTRIKFSI